jgi:hypothetical protein
MDNCYICLEKTSIYFKLKNCKCSIYCHDECFNKILKMNKCILCKKNINNSFIFNKINEEVENVLYIKFLNILYDNFILQNIVKKTSKLNYILFIIYSFVISLLTISLSPIILFFYITSYFYYYLKYRNKIYNNYEKIYMYNKLE